MISTYVAYSRYLSNAALLLWVESWILLLRDLMEKFLLASMRIRLSWQLEDLILVVPIVGHNMYFLNEWSTSYGHVYLPTNFFLFGVGKRSD